jgi:peptidoglycan/LPS O-acetylase OafA/YrhL
MAPPATLTAADGLSEDRPSTRQPDGTPQADPRPPGARGPRYQSLDLWRGLACLMLVIYHASFFVPSPLRPLDLATWSVVGAWVKLATLCWVGVPLFFVVSGYCIAASVDGLQRRPYSMGTFIARRLRRIYPPLWLGCAWAVVVAWAIAGLFPLLFARCPQLPRVDTLSVENWVGNLCASESWQHHLTGTATAYLLPNTWTLCLEEQFYLISGLLLALAARRFFLGALLVTGLTLVCRHANRELGLDAHGCFLEGHWLLFAAGVLVFYQLNRATHLGRMLAYLTLVAGLVYAVLDRSRWATSGEERHIDEYLFVACAFALVLGWLRSLDTRIVQARLTQPFFWCGKRSYSIYLTHYPVVVALAAVLHHAGLDTPALWLAGVLPLCVAVAVCCGWVFHILVERHFLNASLRGDVSFREPIIQRSPGAAG